MVYTVARPTKEIADKMRNLAEIIVHGYPRAHEYDSVLRKIRRRERGKAIKQIVSIYGCSEGEAAVVLEAMKKVALGAAVQLVEISLNDVEIPRPRNSAAPEDPFAIAPQYLVRCGSFVNRLTLRSDGTMLVNEQHVEAKDIDQVWAVKQVP